ncbi:unnamed protein product [Gemmata obscuriglobus UQM 2246]|nr:unnamed protein product [Gemmata obscuriglobus UQM 2246]
MKFGYSHQYAASPVRVCPASPSAGLVGLLCSTAFPSQVVR